MMIQSTMTNHACEIQLFKKWCGSLLFTPSLWIIVVYVIIAWFLQHLLASIMKRHDICHLNCFSIAWRQFSPHMAVGTLPGCDSHLHQQQVEWVALHKLNPRAASLEDLFGPRERVENLEKMWAVQEFPHLIMSWFSSIDDPRWSASRWATCLLFFLSPEWTPRWLGLDIGGEFSQSESWDMWKISVLGVSRNGIVLKLECPECFGSQTTKQQNWDICHTKPTWVFWCLKCFFAQTTKKQNSSWSVACGTQPTCRPFLTTPVRKTTRKMPLRRWPCRPKRPCCQDLIYSWAALAGSNRFAPASPMEW